MGRFQFHFINLRLIQRLLFLNQMIYQKITIKPQKSYKSLTRVTGNLMNFWYLIITQSAHWRVAGPVMFLPFRGCWVSGSGRTRARDQLTSRAAATTLRSSMLSRNCTQSVQILLFYIQLLSKWKVLFHCVHCRYKIHTTVRTSTQYIICTMWTVHVFSF